MHFLGCDQNLSTDIDCFNQLLLSKMVPTGVVSVAMVCLLLPLLVCGRMLPDGHRYDYKGKDKVYDVSNDLSLLTLWSRSRSGGDRTKAALMAEIPIEEIGPPCPTRRLERINPALNNYHIGDYKFNVPTRTSAGIRKRKVLAECGSILGLEDFEQNKPFDDGSKLYSWTKLRATCQVSTVLDGLKEGTGEASIQIKPLRMIVRKLDAEPRSPKIEMNSVKEATVTFRGLEELQSEAINAIKSEIEFRMVCLANSDVRNILKDSMKNSVEKNSLPVLSKLMIPL
ncbi:uncharacterized protein NPIL_181781 [Nephila pilipes]|uniref:Uncharacterized protein n=1 Tax=Nephila pilipes TaxID=299642 RepID=A0A8X6U2J2_NEPPI|nr:uncharacterized protein NPIL_181781 [Nephila pilipes]